MRKLLTVLLIIGSVSIASAQWVAQGTFVDAVTRVIAVNKDVAWVYLRGNPPDNGHLARTIDGGVNWTVGTVAAAPASFNLSCVTPLNADKAWATMVDVTGQTSGGVFKTTDGGVTWIKQETAFRDSGGWPIQIYFFDANEGVCVGEINGGYFEIYTTNNGGDNWERVPRENIPDPLPNEMQSWATFSFSGDVFCIATVILQASSQARLLMSTDRGHTWTASNIGLVVDDPYTCAAFKDPLNGMAVISNGGFTLQLYGVVKTSDGGRTWTRVSSPPPSLDFAEIGSIPGVPGGYVVNSHGFKGGSAFTLDSGATWTLIDTLIHTMPSFLSMEVGWCGGGSQSNAISKWSIFSGREITAFPNSISFSIKEVGRDSEIDTVYITNYSTDDLTISNMVAPGSNFKLVNPPTLPVKLATLHTLFLGLQFTPQTAGNLHDSVVIVSDASNASNLAIPLTGTAIIISNAQPGTIYAASSSLQTLNVSTGAATALAPLGDVQINSLAVRSSTMELLGLCGSTVPETVYQIDCLAGGMLPVCSIPLSGTNLRAIAISPTDTLYAASLAGGLYQVDLLTGKARLIGTATGFRYSSIAFHPLTGQLWATFTNKQDNIYTVDTHTGAVTLVGKTGDNTPTVSITFSSDGKLYGLEGTGSQINKLISIDTVTGAGTEIGSTGVTKLVTIAMSPGTTAVKEKSSEGLPKMYALAQNYPNPFNPQTSFQFGLPEAQVVDIVIYNIMGQVIRRLVHESYQPGIYTVFWDGRNDFGVSVTSGVYLYRIRAGEFVSVRKMIISK
jgi:photosystem II stability/assembly factor-like uncharacterized protein